MYRIGQGFDVHRLVPGRKLILCGNEIPFELGLLGHSDADVAVHAVMDAVLGAMAMGDIGRIFPDSDPKYKNADSMKLLDEILSSPKLQNWKLENLDLTIIAQKPRLAEYIDSMRQKIAGAFKSDIGRISVKATTTEQLGFCGRGEGIAAMASILMTKSG